MVLKFQNMGDKYKILIIGYVFILKYLLFLSLEFAAWSSEPADVQL